jgi:hypothetical protein
MSGSAPISRSAVRGPWRIMAPSLFLTKKVERLKIVALLSDDASTSENGIDEHE